MHPLGVHSSGGPSSGGLWAKHGPPDHSIWAVSGFQNKHQIMIWEISDNTG